MTVGLVKQDSSGSVRETEERVTRKKRKRK
jgi:hypothetical protein